LAGDLAFGITTLHTRAERKLAETEREQYFKFFMTTGDLMCIADPNGSFLITNPACTQTLGYSETELKSKPFIEFIHPDDKQSTLDEMERQQRIGMSFQFENRYICKDGSIRWLSWRATFDKEAGVTYAIARDVTEIKQAQESLLQAKEAAESANRAKDQFLAVLSHELRTPLTPVLATVSARQAQEELPEELRAELDMIRRNVEMEAKLIDDLLDVSKISRGKLELHPEIVDAHLLLRTALDICKKEIASKYLDISLSLQADPHHVRADPTRLRQVFWNLIKNAVEFTPEGGRISLRTTNTNGRLKIEIKDTGVGIRAELLPKIFAAFERGDQDHKVSTRFGGLGLGLSIAKTVVEIHQGTLIAFSEGEGKGATFTVELPCISLTSESPQPPPPGSLAYEERPLKILLVDDHPDTLLTMSKLLRRWGYVVATADCVRAALELADKEPFDLLVSDLGLPDGNGMDIMRELKRRYTMSGIALSGYGTEEDIRQSREAGFAEHLTKPVSFQDLRQAIGRIAASKAA